MGHECEIDNGLSLKANLLRWDKIVFTAGPVKTTLYKSAVMRLFNLKAEFVFCGLMPNIPIKSYLIIRYCIDRFVSNNPEMIKLARVNDIPIIKQNAATFSFSQFLRGRNRQRIYDSKKFISGFTCWALEQKKERF